MNLLKNINVIKATTARVVAAATGLSKAVDMAGFEGCLFIAVGSTLLAATTGSTAGNTKAQLYVKGSSAAAGTYNRYVGHAASSSGLAAGVNKRLLMVDVYKPTDRYLKACLKGSSVASYTDAILAIQYGARRPGSSALQNSTTVAGSTVVASPTTA
jgi:hypothetical protein